jgi:hypothetical protein
MVVSEEATLLYLALGSGVIHLSDRWVQTPELARRSMRRGPTRRRSVERGNGTDQASRQQASSD